MRSLLLAGLLSSAVGAQSFGVTLPPDADTTIDQQAPTINLGTSPNFDFGKYPGPTGPLFMRGLMHFDLTSVLTYPPPLRARLWWYQDPQRTTPFGCATVSVHRVTQSWGETTATWATAPTFDANAEASFSVGAYECTGWRAVDLTNLFKGWWTNQYPNDGFVIRDPTETAPGNARPGLGPSREHPTPSLRPYMEFRWDLQYGQGCGPGIYPPNLALIGGTVALGATGTFIAGIFPANSPTMLLFGISNTTWMGLGLPYNLGQFGFPLCFVLASAEAQIGGVTDNQGNIRWNIQVPNNPTLSGVDFYLQSLSLQGLTPYLTSAMAIRPY